jgi:hypothetical protein
VSLITTLGGTIGSARIAFPKELLMASYFLGLAAVKEADGQLTLSVTVTSDPDRPYQEAGRGTPCRSDAMKAFEGRGAGPRRKRARHAAA